MSKLRGCMKLEYILSNTPSFCKVQRLVAHISDDAIMTIIMLRASSELLTWGTQEHDSICTTIDRT